MNQNLQFPRKPTQEKSTNTPIRARILKYKTRRRISLTMEKQCNAIPKKDSISQRASWKCHILSLQCAHTPNFRKKGLSTWLWIGVAGYRWKLDVLTSKKRHSLDHYRFHFITQNTALCFLSFVFGLFLFFIKSSPNSEVRILSQV